MSQTKVQLVNDVSGDSGFGISSAESVLHVSKAVSAGSDNFLLRMQNPTNASDARVGMFFHVNAVTGSGSDGAYIESTNSGSDNGDIRFGSITNLTKSERMRIDSSGDIGVGVTSPDGRFHIMGGNLGGAGSVTAASDAQLLVLESNDSNGLSLLNANDERANIRFGTTGTDGNLEASISYGHEAVSTTNDRRAMIFKTGGNVERFRINTGGRVLVGTSSPVANGIFEVVGNIGFNDCLVGYRRTNDDTANRAFTRFQSSNGTQIGFIGATASNVSYNTSSDYRLKENVVSISDGITRLKTLKPSRFNFIADAETTVDGFLAHEVTAVPEAVTGTKDEVDSDDKPIYQGIDQSKLVPLLTAALQEEIAKREALETRVATLEAA